jgi:hypothetical protein
MLYVLAGRCEIKFGLFLSSLPPSLPPLFLYIPLSGAAHINVALFIYVSRYVQKFEYGRTDGRICIAFYIWEFDKRFLSHLTLVKYEET